MGFSLNNSDERSPVAEINVTPLVDVMLVLLVIFMVTAPLMENGIPIQLPKASAKALPKDQVPMTLTLTKEARIYLNGREELFLSNLPARLQVVFKGHQDKQIFIRAEGSLTYEFVAKTMALVKSAGIDRIGLVTQPPEGSSPAKK